MGQYITPGQFNKLYRYMGYQIILKIILDYLIEDILPEKTKIFEKNKFPPHLFIQEGFNYLGTFFFSIFLVNYEINHIKKNQKISDDHAKRTLSEIKYIYKDGEGKICNINSIIIIVLLFISTQLKNIFFVFSLKGLDFWVPELLFICYLTKKMFRIPIYLHKKASIIFILIFCSIMKILSIIYRFIDDTKPKLYKIYKWITPIGIIYFILILYLRCYCFCKIKSLFELEIILSSKFLALYGFFGAFICFIVSAITHNVPCVDKNDFENINLICRVNNTINDNYPIYYYENYSLFFKKLWDNNRYILINIGFLLLFLLKIILSFITKLYSIIIIQKLNPEYYIASNSIHFFFTGLIDFFIYLFSTNGEFKFYKFYETFAEFFKLLGYIVYLEFIELNFCGLNKNLKRNIRIRSLSEIQTEFLIENEAEDSRSSDISNN